MTGDLLHYYKQENIDIHNRDYYGMQGVAKYKFLYFLICVKFGCITVSNLRHLSDVTLF